MQNETISLNPRVLELPVSAPAPQPAVRSSLRLADSDSSLRVWSAQAVNPAMENWVWMLLAASAFWVVALCF